MESMTMPSSSISTLTAQTLMILLHSTLVQYIYIYMCLLSLSLSLSLSCIPQNPSEHPCSLDLWVLHGFLCRSKTVSGIHITSGPPEVRASRPWGRPNRKPHRCAVVPSPCLGSATTLVIHSNGRQDHHRTRKGATSSTLQTSKTLSEVDKVDPLRQIIVL